MIFNVKKHVQNTFKYIKILFLIERKYKISLERKIGCLVNNTSMKVEVITKEDILINKHTISFLTALILIGTTLVTAEVHKGLKDAIDNEDMKAAKAIVNNLKIMDIYCPASLTVKNGETLFGERFAKDPSLLYTNCEKEFIRSYLETACFKKDNFQLCKSALDSTKISEWTPLLKDIKKNGLDKILEKYEEEVTSERKATRAECEEDILTDGEFTAYAELMESEGNTEGVKQERASWIRKCMKDVVKEDIKTIKKTRTIYPFETYFTKFIEESIKGSMKLYDYTEDDEKALTFAKTLIPYDIKKKTVDEYVTFSVKSYKDSAYINDQLILAACRYEPTFDKKLEKVAGFPIITCKNAFATYSADNLPLCTSSSGTMVNTVPIMEGAPTYQYTCIDNMWKPSTGAAPAQKKEVKKEVKSSTATAASKSTSAPASTENKVSLKIFSSPRGASILVNKRKAKEITPTTIYVKPNTYTISIQKEGYITRDTVMTLNKPEQILNMILEME